MAYISKYDTKFLTFMNRKYQQFNAFEYFDDYILWLYYDFCNKDEELYYKTLEKDLWEYVDFQNGKERDNRDTLQSRWEDEKANIRTARESKANL